ncbi:MAG: DUF1501 domain-containing protein [Planctomycetes bacterium]|nr:DUF1501 domain-containing protein [Planctomycetota bacterium]
MSDRPECGAGSAGRLLREQTRRHFFGGCGVGVGSLALGELLAGKAGAAAVADPLAPRAPHFAPRAKRVIYLFMAGGPSQLDLFDYKPELARRSGTPIPESFIAGKRFAFMDSSHRIDLLGSKRSFRQVGANGTWVSDLLPETGRIVDRLCIVKSCSTDLFNHAPAKLFMNTGSGQFGRPSMGAWLTYGLGSECRDLPGFVVLQSGPRGPRGGAVLWGSGILPSAYQGVPLRNSGDPILNLSAPAGVDAARQRRVVDAVRALNERRLAATGDDEIAARVAGYEMAYRMQSSAPDLIDVAGESAETLALYGIRDPRETTYARNCLLARRLVERGVRFVQLYHTNWDHHGGTTENLETHLPEICGQVDRASSALVLDLERRGLLDDTIVVWGGEFGRTPMGEKRESTGRNHHIDAFTMWFAGGGFRPGLVHGETDEFGFAPVAGGLHVRDIHATLLHCLGLDHQRLAVRFQGLDYKLTGVKPARVATELLA